MSKNVFKDLGFSEEEAAGLKLKSYLFIALQEAITKSGMTQQEVAEAIGADQPKVSKICNGKFSEFSIERITEYLQHLGYDIHISTSPCPPSRKEGTVVMDKRTLAAAGKK
jgi:predicted XRE-type DNA-binding protein